MKAQNLNSKLEKINALLRASKASTSIKTEIWTFAKSPNVFGYSQEKIIEALQMGLILKAGGRVSDMIFSDGSEKKGTATFFNNYVLPIYTGRRNYYTGRRN